MAVAESAGTLAGRVALVCGASSGIGQATAIALGAAGAAVVAVARRTDRLNTTIERIVAAGGQGLALVGDVSVETFATSVVDETQKRFGRLDILVNSAGVMQAANVEHADTMQWRRVMEVAGLPPRVNISEVWIRATTDVVY